tara:strand:+ start:690 stop:998 length:309 start_codon:yes stop_codon:yes gene_type:complete
MSWETILKKESGKTIEQFRGLFAPMVEAYLNDNIFDENDYTEEKMKELQDEINRGDVLAGMGKYLDIKLSLDDSDGYYVDVEGDGRELLSLQFDLKGRMRRL